LTSIVVKQAGLVEMEEYLVICRHYQVKWSYFIIFVIMCETFSMCISCSFFIFSKN